MVCQECGNRPATLHFTKIVNGEKTEFHICEHCAREKGDFLPGTTNGFSIHNLLSGLLDFETPNTGSSVLGKVPPQATQCKKCGLTYTQFTKIGRFGCDECYDQFAERLDPLFRRIHGTTDHAGKIPKRNGGLIHDKRQIESLKKHLKLLIEREEFEEAAKLRDQIRELEEKVSGQ